MEPMNGALFGDHVIKQGACPKALDAIVATEPERWSEHTLAFVNADGEQISGQVHDIVDAWDGFWEITLVNRETDQLAVIEYEPGASRKGAARIMRLSRIDLTQLPKPGVARDLTKRARDLVRGQNPTMMARRPDTARKLMRTLILVVTTLAPDLIDNLEEALDLTENMLVIMRMNPGMPPPVALAQARTAPPGTGGMEN